MILKLSKKTVITGCFSIIGIIFIVVFTSFSSIIGVIPGHAEVFDLEVKDEFVFLNEDGLIIVDSTHPRNPRIIKIIDMLNPQWISLQEDYAFLQDGRGDLHIVDISNPYNAEIVSVLETEGVALIQGSLLYSVKSPNTMLSGRFSVYNFSNPQNPILISEGSEIISWAKDFKVHENYGYVIGGEALLTILDLSNSSDVKITSTLFDDGIDRHAGQHIQIYDNIAYIADFNHISYESEKYILYAINISNPITPEIIWKLDSRDVGNMWVEPDLLYCTSFRNGLTIFDISNPQNPVLIDSYKQGFSIYNGVEVHNNKIYITGVPRLLILNNKDLGKFSCFFQNYIFRWLSIIFTVLIGLLSIGFFISDLISAKRKSKVPDQADFLDRDLSQ
jgi:hypothetical protein